MADVITYGALDVLTGILDDESWEIGWGTGAAVAARADTTLSSEATEDRVSATLTRETQSQTNDTLVCAGTMTCNATAKTITNAGILTAAGTLILHTSFTGIPVVEGDTLAFVFKWRMK